MYLNFHCSPKMINNLYKWSKIVQFGFFLKNTKYENGHLSLNKSWANFLIFKSIRIFWTNIFIRKDICKFLLRQIYLDIHLWYLSCQIYWDIHPSNIYGIKYIQMFICLKKNYIPPALQFTHLWKKWGDKPTWIHHKLGEDYSV